MIFLEYFESEGVQIEQLNDYVNAQFAITKYKRIVDLPIVNLDNPQVHFFYNEFLFLLKRLFDNMDGGDYTVKLSIEKVI